MMEKKLTNGADNVEKIVEDKNLELDNKDLSDVAGGSIKYRPEDPDVLPQKAVALAEKDPHNII